MRLAPTRALLSLVFLAAVPLSTGSALAGESVEPAPHHPLVGHLVAGSLSSYHYAAHEIDDEVSEAWFQAYLDDLDPARLFFFESDVARFRKRATTLDDDIQATQPGLELAFDMHALYRQRAIESYTFAKQALTEDMSFDNPEAGMELDRSDAAFPADEAARQALWRTRVRAQVLDRRLLGEDMERAREILTKRYDRTLSYMEKVEPPDVMEVYLSSLAAVFDPHSSYFKPANQEDFDIRMRDSLEGIGAELRSTDGYTEVGRLIAGGPAEATGELQPGDYILAVAQGADEPVDVVDMRLDNVVKLIRGEKGTEVRLTVRPGDATDTSQTRVVRIVRDKVILERASAKAELKTVPVKGGGQLKVGVIEVPSFYVDAWAMRRGDPSARSTTRDVEKLIGDMRKEGAEALVIDLRANGGGALSEAISLTGLFIDKGPVVQVKDPQRGIEVLEDEDRGVAWSGPMAVLTDELSASASEIFAGAIQDYRRGIVVGAPQTHGKGTVQQMLDLGRVLQDGPFKDVADQAGALKLTVQKFYRVSGASTQTRGVVPDVVIPSPWEGIDVLESDLDGHLAWDEIGAARYSPLGNAPSLSALRSASAARIASEPVFGWLAEDVAERARRRADDRISLDETTRKHERETIEARNKARLKTLGIDPGEATVHTDPEERDTDVDEDAPPTLDDVLEDAILAEALAVTADYSRVWTPPAELVEADPLMRSAGTKDRVPRKR